MVLRVCVCVHSQKINMSLCVRYERRFGVCIRNTQNSHAGSTDTKANNQANERESRESWHFSWFDFPTDGYIMICYSYMVIIPYSMCICSCSITIFYMRCLNVDRPLCFRTENIYGCFFASSSIDVEFSWVECEYECVCMCIWAMKFSLGFFSLSANKHFQWLYFVRARTRTWNDKMRIQSVAKIRLSLPKPIRMKSAKFVFVHKCVELYILYLSMRLAITPSCSLPPSHSHNVRSKEEKKHKHLPFYQRFIVVNGFVCFV